MCKGQIHVRLNPKKTEYLTINMPDEPLKTIGNVELRNWKTSSTLDIG